MRAWLRGLSRSCVHGWRLRANRRLVRTFRTGVSAHAVSRPASPNLAALSRAFGVSKERRELNLDISGPSSKAVVKNRKIRAAQVRVIDTDGKNKGVVAFKEAMAMAEQQNCDLVQVMQRGADTICKLTARDNEDRDQKVKEEAERLESDQKKLKPMKIIRVRAGITENDLSIKLKVGSKQLKKGHPVDVVIQPPKRRIEDQDSAQKMIVEMVYKELVEEAEGHPMFPLKQAKSRKSIVVSPVPFRT